MNIDNAIECMKIEMEGNTCSDCTCISCDTKEELKNTHKIALASLLEKKERDENKALTLEDLKHMIGEPIWCNAVNKWNVLTSIKNNDTLVFADKSQKYSKTSYYKYKKVPNVVNNKNRVMDLLNKFAAKHPEVLHTKSMNALDIYELEDFMEDTFTLISDIFRRD